MNINRSIAKKQITLITLVIALGLAVYLNYRLSNVKIKPLDITETILGAQDVPADVPVENSELTTNEDTEYYGETMFVASDVSEYSGTYFTEARMNRSESRDEALDTLKKSLQNTELTEAEKTQLTSQLSATAASISKETTVESLVKSKGFADCIAFIGDNAVKIVVASGSDGLTSSEVAQIKEIVITECSVPAIAITIVEIK